MPVLGAVAKSALVQRDELSEVSYDYGMVLASSRSQGIDFWGESMASQRHAACTHGRETFKPLLCRFTWVHAQRI